MQNTTEYQVLVKTNSYAGNFERELCAFMTGHIGECEVGSELVNPDVKAKFENFIRTMPDDHACYRPVALDDDDANNMIIFLEGPLTAEQMNLLERRAHLFETTRPYQYLDVNFKFLGLELIKVTTGVTREEIKF